MIAHKTSSLGILLASLAALSCAPLASFATSLGTSPISIAEDDKDNSAKKGNNLALIPNPSVDQGQSPNSYILGPEDRIYMEMIDIPELSGFFSIGPDGTIYLPRLRSVKAEGLTVKGLTDLLTDRYKEYVKDPDIYINITKYRPIRIYVGGEVKRPGYYTLAGARSADFEIDKTVSKFPGLRDLNAELADRASDPLTGNDQRINVFPTVFDAIRASLGITPYSDLSKVEITRKRPLESGGGLIRTKVDFLTLITNGDESQNLRLLDGDYVKVEKSSLVLRDQLLKASQTNLSPLFLKVFVGGRVEAPGAITLPNGSSLNKALLAASPKLLKGKVEFVRFTKGGEVDRRLFSYKPTAPVSDYRNPILMTGDIVRVQESIFTSTMKVIKEVSDPFIGIYSLYRLIDSIN